MMPDLLTVTATDHPAGVRVLHVSGDLDHDSAPTLRTAVDEALRAGRHRLIADLSEVTFCDSAGLSLFVETHRRTRAENTEGWFRLAGPRDEVRYVLEATNLGGYLNVHTDVAEALRGEGNEAAGGAGG